MLSKRWPLDSSLSVATVNEIFLTFSSLRSIMSELGLKLKKLDKIEYIKIVQQGIEQNLTVYDMLVISLELWLLRILLLPEFQFHQLGCLLSVARPCFSTRPVLTDFYIRSVRTRLTRLSLFGVLAEQA